MEELITLEILALKIAKLEEKIAKLEKEGYFDGVFLDGTPEYVRKFAEGEHK